MSEITKTEEPQLQTPRQWLAPKMTNRQTFRPSKMSNCDTNWMETQTQQFITIYYPDYLRNKCCLSACRCRDFTYSKFLCLFFDKGIIFWISGNRQLAKFPNVTTMGNWGVSSHIHHNEVHFSHLWNIGGLLNVNLRNAYLKIFSIELVNIIFLMIFDSRENSSKMPRKYVVHNSPMKILLWKNEILNCRRWKT